MTAKKSMHIPRPAPKIKVPPRVTPSGKGTIKSVKELHKGK